jgi:hypothetical protein
VAVLPRPSDNGRGVKWWQEPSPRIVSDLGAGDPRPPRVREEDLPYVLSPIAPSDPRHSDGARLLFAYLDAVAGADSAGELALLEVLLAAQDEEFADHPRHRQLRDLMGAGLLSHADQHVAAEVHSQLARQAARAAGLLSDVEHWLWRAGVQLSREGRDLLKLPYARALDELMGWEDVDGWHPGCAGLEPQEQAAFRLSLTLHGERNERGTWTYSLLQPWEIARQMRRKRGDVRDGLPVETVDRYLREARAKVQGYLLP